MSCLRLHQILFLIVALILPLGAYANGNQTMALDIYVGVMPHPDEPDYVSVYFGPRDVVVIPKSKLGKDGRIQYDPKLFDGAPKFKEKIDQLVTDTNTAYEGTGVQFQLRNLTFISTDQTDLKPHFDAENQQMNMSVKDGKSDLLSGFDTATSGSGGAFRVFMADLSIEGGEAGRAGTPGTVSTIHIAQALDPRNNGRILIHELGHNLGLDDDHDADPFSRGMAGGEPSRQGPTQVKEADPALTAEEKSTIKTRVGKGIYKKYVYKGSVTKTKAATSKKSGTPSKTKTDAKKTDDHSYLPPEESSSQTETVAFNVSGEFGSVDLGTFGLPVRYQLEDGLGDLSITRKFLAQRGEENIAGINTQLDVRFSCGFAEDMNIRGSFARLDYLTAESSWGWDTVSGWGDPVALLYPSGEAGGGNNGLLIGGATGGNGSFSDVEHFGYTGEYEEFKSAVGLEFGPYDFVNGQLIPRFGFFYGFTEETAKISGVTADGWQDFEYDNKLEVDRYAIIVGAKFLYDLADAITFYGDVESRFILNNGEAYSSFETWGLVSISDQVYVTDRHYDLGVVARAGINVDVADNVVIQGGIQLERWDVGVFDYPLDNTSSEPQGMDLNWQSRSSVTVQFGAWFFF